MKRLLFIIFLSALLIPNFSMANLQSCSDSAGNQVALCNPAAAGIDTLQMALTYLAKTFGLLMGLTVIIMVVFSGFRMIASGGNEEEITKSKAALQWTLSGFVLSLFAYVIISAIGNYIGTKDIPEGTNPVQNPLTSNTFGDLLTKMITGFLEVAGLLAILMIIIAGFRYITAQGNEEQVTQAKQSLQWAIIGLVVALLAYVIVVATAKLFGAQV